jgi:hypothetical protein
MSRAGRLVSGVGGLVRGVASSGEQQVEREHKAHCLIKRKEEDDGDDDDKEEEESNQSELTESRSCARWPHCRSADGDDACKLCFGNA